MKVSYTYSYVVSTCKQRCVAIGAVHCDGSSLDFVDDFILELQLHMGVARRYLCCYDDDNLVWQF